MKRSWLVLLGGLALALVAYGSAYLLSSAPCRSMEQSQTPELAWLQQEFGLSDAERARISKLHESYLAGCADRCQRIDAKNAELKALLTNTNTVTDQIEHALHDAARLRAECQKAMLQHFYEVSQTMPADQGRRYLAWVIARTLAPAHETMTPQATATDHEHHHE